MAICVKKNLRLYNVLVPSTGVVAWLLVKVNFSNDDFSLIFIYVDNYWAFLITLIHISFSVYDSDTHL